MYNFILKLKGTHAVLLSVAGATVSVCASLPPPRSAAAIGPAGEELAAMLPEATNGRLLPLDLAVWGIQ